MAMGSEHFKDAHLLAHLSLQGLQDEIDEAVKALNFQQLTDAELEAAHLRHGRALAEMIARTQNLKSAAALGSA